jgi:Uma2 family endonuclease
MGKSNTMRRARAGGRLYLTGVDWKTYSRFLRLFAERPGYRLTYDRGELEIMSPSLQHDDEGWFLGRLVFVLTEELGLPVKNGGSVTMRRRGLQKGIEPDACFWIANAHRLSGTRQLDLRVHPPPDLAIEVDVTRSSINRMNIYARLGVPEVWRLDGDVLTFHVLGPNRVYAESSTSRSFPGIAPADLLPVLQTSRQVTDDNPVVRQFRAWVRQRAATSPPAPPASNP